MNLLTRIKSALVSLLTRHEGGNVIPYGYMTSFGSTGSYNYLRYAEEGFRQNPVVYACIREIYDASSRVKLQLMNDGEKVESDSKYDPVLQLFKRPNPEQSMHQFIKQMIVYLLIGGVVYVRMIGVGTEAFGPDVRVKTAPVLFLERPDFVTIKREGRLVTGYKVLRPDGTGEVDYDTDQMFHINLPDALGEQTAGMEPTRAAAQVIDAHNLALEWNTNTLLRGGSLSSLLSIKGVRSLDPVARDKLAHDFETKFSGAQQAGKMAVIPHEVMDYHAIGMTAKDLDWSKGKRDVMRDICIVYGVPSQMLNDPEASTYANYQEARKAFYVETVLPIMDQVIEEFNYRLVTRWSKTLELITNTDNIDALRETQTDLVNRLKASTWMTIDEKRLVMGLDELSKYGDLILIPSSMTTLESIANPEEPEEPEEEKKDNTHSMYSTEALRIHAWSKRDARRLSWEEKFAVEMDSFFMAQGKRIATELRKLTHALTPPDPLPVSDAFLTSLFETWDEDLALRNHIRSIHAEMVIDFGQAAIDELTTSGILFNIERLAISEFLANDLAVRSRLINQSTATQMQKIINAGVSEGESVVRIADRLLDTYPLSNTRALAIARTETGRASTEASLAGYEQMNVEMKEWLSSRDDKVRDEHVEMDGQIVRMQDDFIGPSGQQCSGPGMSGDPGFDINCRCIVVPLMVGEKTI